MVVDPINYRALLLNNVYDGSDAPLPGTDTDVKAIKNMLNNMSATAYTVYTGRELTATQMLDKIDDVFSLADDNDVTLLHYSGHGADFSDVDAYDGSLCGINNTYITPTQLRTALDQYKGKKIIMLDSCFSGNMIASGSGLNNADDQEQTDAYVNAFVNAFSMRTRSNLAADNYYVIAACSKTQTSGELTFENNITGELISCGFFTLALTDGCGWDLLGDARLGKLYADANSDSQITLNEAYNHVVDYVEDFVTENPGFTSQSTQVYPPNSAQVLFGR